MFVLLPWSIVKMLAQLGQHFELHTLPKGCMIVVEGRLGFSICISARRVAKKLPYIGYVLRPRLWCLCLLTYIHVCPFLIYTTRKLTRLRNILNKALYKDHNVDNGPFHCLCKLGLYMSEEGQNLLLCDLCLGTTKSIRLFFLLFHTLYKILYIILLWFHGIIQSHILLQSILGGLPRSANALECLQ